MGAWVSLQSLIIHNSLYLTTVQSRGSKFNQNPDNCYLILIKSLVIFVSHAVEHCL